MQITKTSAEVMTCHPCRRARRAAAKAAAGVGPWVKVCINEQCRKSFTADQMSRRFCSQDCLLENHKAMERIRDAERRRMKHNQPDAWGCNRCYIKYALVEAPEFFHNPERMTPASTALRLGRSVVRTREAL